MVRIRVPYTPVLKFDEEPMPAWGIAKDTNDIIFRCACGELSNISRWTITPDGDVNPSLNHTLGGGCDFHEFITLEEYKDRVHDGD